MEIFSLHFMYKPCRYEFKYSIFETSSIPNKSLLEIFPRIRIGCPAVSIYGVVAPANRGCMLYQDRLVPSAGSRRMCSQTGTILPFLRLLMCEQPDFAPRQELERSGREPFSIRPPPGLIHQVDRDQRLARLPRPKALSRSPSVLLQAARVSSLKRVVSLAPGTRRSIPTKPPISRL